MKFISDLNFSSNPERDVIDGKTLELNAIKVIGHFHNYNAHPPLPPQKFPNYLEIFLVEKGIHERCINNKTYRLTPKNGIIIYPGQVHSTSNIPEKRGQVYWIHIDITAKHILHLNSSDSNILRDAILLYKKNNCSCTDNTLENLRTIFSIYHNEKMNKAYKRIMIQTLLQKSILDIFMLKPQSNYTISPPISRVCAHIRQNIYKPMPSIADLAKIAFISPSYLKKKFTKEVGCPPIEYFNIQKIEEAKIILLSKPNISASAVGEILSFEDSSYFFKVFKKHVGMPPKTWLQKNTHLVSQKVKNK